ncbi:MAG TPA: M48 family metalloprotease, partial [Steroidobacteraceae bacterium]|nr:M48 family metalloprotease [Steroidobacteraceae bacterium]
LGGMLYPRSDPSLWHAAFVRSHSGWLIGALLLGVCLAASARKAWQLRGGGARVAEALGGSLLTPGRGTDQQRRLMNVVAEMALAARIPPPQVFLLAEERSINAFAAGLTPQTAALGMTGGALAALNRDELQAVVAHEFSHILNGDMALNTRLVAWLHGLTVMTNLARRMRQRKRARLFTWQFHLYVWIFYVVGSLGTFVGQLLQAAISRRREELADASAVQFTRNPGALKSALVKIEAAEGAGRIHSTHAADLAHMFFAESRMPVAQWLARLKGAFLATHPPMLHRVRALDPGLTAAQHRALVRRERKQLLQKDEAVKAPVVVAGEVLHAPAAAPRLMHEELPELLLGRLRPESRQALESVTAEVAPDQDALQAMFIGALLAPEAARARAQLVQLAPLLGASITARVQKDRARLDQLPPFARLPTLTVLLPRLSTLPDRERARLVKIARAFQTQIAPRDVLRFAVARLIPQRLAVAAPAAAGYVTIEGTARSCALLCAWMASFNDVAAEAAFQAGLNGLLPPLQRPVYNAAAITTEAIDTALEQALRLPPVGKRALNDALLRVLGSDQSMDAPEFDLLRFVSLRLGVAVPSVPLSIRSAANSA